MDSFYMSTEGMNEAEGMLLSMIVSFASDQLDYPWMVKAGADVHAVMYDFTNPRARMACERNRGASYPVVVALSEEALPSMQWVLQKPIRAHTLIPFLNDLSAWIRQRAPITQDKTVSYRPEADPFSQLKSRLVSVASERLSQAGGLQEIKLIIAGSVAAGKTTAISTISDVPPVRTDVAASDYVAKMKSQTTVAMDYGECTLPDGKKLRLYGTPGQRRYDFMSKILCRGALGLIVLLDNRAPNPLSELDYYSYVFSDLIKESAMVVGVTHRDEAPQPGLDKYEHYLHVQQKPWPVFPIDPRNKADVVTLLDALVTMLEHARRPHDVGVGRY
jgi:uncharacterized protein